MAFRLTSDELAEKARHAELLTDLEAKLAEAVSEANGKVQDALAALSVVVGAYNDALAGAREFAKQVSTWAGKAQDAETPTRVIVEPYDAKRYLSEKATVRFVLSDRSDHWVDCKLAQSRQDLTGRVAVEMSGGGSIDVLPVVSNVVLVAMRKW